MHGGMLIVSDSEYLMSQVTPLLGMCPASESLLA